MSKSNILVQ